MSGLILAVPSKGRLEADTRRIFVEAGLAIERPGGTRSYQGDIAALPDIAVRFLPASEIARELIHGKVHVGVTGADLIHEASERGPDTVDFVKPLGFGGADVVIAVPDAWIDVVSMRDLADVASDFRAGHGRWLRVATKYLNLTRRTFARYGIAEYRIVESLGATEAAPTVGVADLVVDITSTGSTLAANGLRVIEDGLVLRSEANLIVSRTANWTPEATVLRDRLLAAFGVGGA